MFVKDFFSSFFFHFVNSDNSSYILGGYCQQILLKLKKQTHPKYDIAVPGFLYSYCYFCYTMYRDKAIWTIVKFINYNCYLYIYSLGFILKVIRELLIISSWLIHTCAAAGCELPYKCHLFYWCNLCKISTILSTCILKIKFRTIISVIYKDTLRLWSSLILTNSPNFSGRIEDSIKHP